ncbi:MAG: NHL repeat-containing protein [Candidatus Latescibacterota bacterium]|nr:MAG: NHL repeat-containing protein [Candidatus Latescibacterota bacterium]
MRPILGLAALLLWGGAAAALEPPEFLYSFGRTGSGLGFMRGPGGVARDASGLFYVAEIRGHRVQVFDSLGTGLRTWGGRGAAPGQFAGPSDIVIDDQERVWVSDRDNGRLQWFTLAGEFLGELGASQGVPFDSPGGLGLDPPGVHLFVSDVGNSKIFKLDISGQTPRLVMSFGELGAEAGQLAAPTDVAVSPRGEIHVVEFLTSRVQIFSETGAFRFAFGFAGDAPGRFAAPSGVTVDSEGRIYVVDTYNSRVQVFERKGHFLFEFGREGTKLERLNEPTRMILTPDGLLVLCDADEAEHSDRVVIFSWPTAVRKKSWTDVRSLFRGR